MSQRRITQPHQSSRFLCLADRVRFCLKASASPQGEDRGSLKIRRVVSDHRQVIDQGHRGDHQVHAGTSMPFAAIESGPDQTRWHSPGR